MKNNIIVNLYSKEYGSLNHESLMIYFSENCKVPLIGIDDGNEYWYIELESEEKIDQIIENLQKVKQELQLRNKSKGV